MSKRPNSNKSLAKYQFIIFLLLLSFSFLLVSPRKVHAQGTDINQFIANVWLPIKEFAKKAYEKGGAAAFQTAVRTSVNKIAYDTATWLGSGGEGQKPLFVTKGWGSYIGQIGDEAAGQFLESAVFNWQNADFKSDGKGSKQNEQCKLAYDQCVVGSNKEYDQCSAACPAGDFACKGKCMTSFPDKTKEQCESELLQCSGVGTGSDGVTQSRQSGTSNLAPLVCRPSSLDSRLRIAMSLVDYNRPQAPNCTASEMVENWGDAYSRQVGMYTDPNFLRKFSGIFDPTSNDLGIFYTLSTGQNTIVNSKEKLASDQLKSDGGWLNVRDIAGNLVGTPDGSKRRVEMAEQGYISNMAEFSGDALIDAANVFLNQFAVSLFNRKMSNLGKDASSNVGNINDPGVDPLIRYGEGSVRESLAEIIKPNFSPVTDFNILVALSSCRDREKPGPTDCVIDDRLMQGITDKLTVAEAMEKGNLRGDWKFTTEYIEEAYNIRNIKILRKYRIVPLSWEVAANYNKNATLKDLVSCFSGDDDHNSWSSNFNTNDQTWCRGLVDPNWVLKAPLNYCSVQGFSPQILSTSVIPNTSGSLAVRDSVIVVRAEDYCGDDQTCISENSDGTCRTYGHCLSERGTWNFNSPSCEPISNTCSSFASSKGQQVSYLENTLDYGDCTVDSVGCQRYSTNGSYDVTTGKVSWSANPFANAYFNDKLEDCSANAEGCQEMMLIQPGSVANLVMGADFATDNIGDKAVDSKINNYWSIWSEPSTTRNAEIIDTSSLDGVPIGKAIRASSTGRVIGIFSDSSASLLPANLNVNSDETFTLSADVYLIKGSKVHAILGGGYEAVEEITDKDVWRHLSVTRSLQEKPLSELSFQITAYSDGGPTEFAARNIKLEMSSQESEFSSYGTEAKIYSKLIPNYLKDTCYENTNSSGPDYRLKVDAPSVCNNYSRQCNLEEAGCDRFSQLKTGFSVAAQAVTTDYCDASCDGYNLYISRANHFYSPQVEKMIPQNSQSCSAAAVGCSEFTNLDEVGSGGENKEYYAKLKQCIKPGGECADFYHWVGTEESGYQLKSLILKKDASGNPASTSDTASYCNEEIFNLPPNDPFFNPECREYYNKGGQTSYRLSANTITCSDDCHNYRLSENNVDSTVSQSQCVGTDRSWDITRSQCNVCKNGGIWNNSYKACLYQGIPSESTSCRAVDNGCREYNGSLGNNTRLALSNSFTYGLEGWEGQCGDNAVHSPVANSNNGQSMMYDFGSNSAGSQGQAVQCEQSQPLTWLDKITKTAKADPAAFIRNIVGNSVQEGKSYSLKFTASAPSDTNVSIAFLNTNDEMAYFNASTNNQNGNFIVSGNNEWQTYELNLENLGHRVDSAEALVIVANRDFYIDNLILTEITNRYYLVKETSKIPEVCYYDMLDSYQGPDYNLGCSAYNDRNNGLHYLRQFNKLCQDSAVGCSMMIDTANYDSFKGNIWQDVNDNNLCDSNEPDCIKVDGDRFFYAIYDKNKACNRADLGCSLLGESISSAQNLNWSDTFKRNNPNKYDATICSSSDAGCEAWNYLDGRGTTYFKNPFNDVCVYRNGSNPENNGKNWYQVPVMRCDLNANGIIDGNEMGTKICSSASDCSGERACIMDNNDYDCPVSYFKTFGYGGGGRQIPVPSESAALCEPSQSGCTEYIEPISSFSNNLVRDPHYDNNINAWKGTGSTTSQIINVEPNSLYIFSVNTSKSSLSHNVRVQSGIGLAQLLEDNYLNTKLVDKLVIDKDHPEQRYIFHSRNNRYVTVLGAHANHEIILKKAIIDYQLVKNVNKSECKKVDQSNGCVLFNERSINGSKGLQSLSGYYNAAASLSGSSPVKCGTGNCDANTLIKVRPDRTCASWMDCKTWLIDEETGEKTCYAVGECNALNNEGDCINFVEVSDDVINRDNTVDLNKLTGYSILDSYSLARMKELGLNTTAHFNFENASPSLYCIEAGTTTPCDFVGSIQQNSIIDSPDKSKVAGEYPAEGRAYLRVMAGHIITPHSINSPIILPDQELTHYLNFLVNTQNSGIRAKVSVLDYKTGNPIATETFSANSGWERKIMKFNVPKDTSASKNNQVVIQLSVEDNDRKEERYVYFDDINIEPVLDLGGGKYVAKECRLYPTEDAVSCSSINSNVVKDGLIGYCLQHDPQNKNVCLLWYPVDEISANLKSARSVLGYQGVFPLNYCTEANGDFELVENRKTYFVTSVDFSDPMPSLINPSKDYKCDPYDCNLPSLGGGGCGDSGETCCMRATTMGRGVKCPEGYYLFSSQYPYDNNKDNTCHIDYWCVPQGSAPQKLYVERRNQDTGCEFNLMNTWWTSAIGNNNVFVSTAANYSNGKNVRGGECGNQTRVKSDSDGWYPYNGLHADENKNADPSVRVFNLNYPTVDEDDLKLISSSDPEKVFYPTCNKFVQVVDADGNNKAWADRVSKRDVIYPYDTPKFFRDNEYFYGFTPSSCYVYDQVCAEECSCDNFCECEKDKSQQQIGPDDCVHPCDEVGLGGCAFFTSIKRIVDCSTPGALGGMSPNAFNFTKYGRNREQTPYGAAIIPDNYNIFASPAIMFRNQYSDRIRQQAFAGRPYGCSGVSCNNIGYCSLDPSIYCILDDSSSANKSLVNQRSCGSANGTCLPMWNGDRVTATNTPPVFKADNILKNTFLSSYDAYEFNLDIGTYLGAKGYNGNGGSNNYTDSITEECEERGDCHTTGNDTNFSAYWKYVLPKIENVKIDDVLTTTWADIKSPGIYKFSFTTMIDKEQQPLRDLIIDWGDGTIQNLVNQDSRPDVSNPHVVYHYYSTAGRMKFTIRVTDNWGFYRTWLSR